MTRSTAGPKQLGINIRWEKMKMGLACKNVSPITIRLN